MRSPDVRTATVKASTGLLLVRQVDLGRRVLVQASVLDVPHDTDDRLRSTADAAHQLGADANLLTHGVPGRKVSPCGLFVDEDDLRTRRRITAVEWPPRADGNPHHLEVVGTDDPQRRRRHRCRIRLPLALVTKAGDGVQIARERQTHRDCGRLHSGLRLQSRQQRGDECSRTRGVAVPGGRQREAERRDAFGSKPGSTCWR